MERSLAVPTATSFRNVPAKLLEVNRKVINGYRSRSGMGKVSFTHIIGYAIVRAIADAVPVMRNTYAVGRRRQAAPRHQRLGQPRPRRRRREVRREPDARRPRHPRCRQA
jgi:pyruvate/2-oxoglutarate dehydrogenase complex dihydrolipoamide acyltransferase (E2) component